MTGSPLTQLISFTVWWAVLVYPIGWGLTLQDSPGPYLVPVVSLKFFYLGWLLIDWLVNQCSHSPAPPPPPVLLVCFTNFREIVTSTNHCKRHYTGYTWHWCLGWGMWKVRYGRSMCFFSGCISFQELPRVQPSHSYPNPILLGSNGVFIL